MPAGANNFSASRQTLTVGAAVFRSVGRNTGTSRVLAFLGLSHRFSNLRSLDFEAQRGYGEYDAVSGPKDGVYGPWKGAREDPNL
jgi:hypothetical protein